MLEYTMSFLTVFAMIPLAATVIADVKKDMPAISWENTFENAVTKAKTAGKPILLDFFSPT